MSSVPKFGTLGMKQKRERKRAMQLYDTQLENGLPVLVKEQEIMTEIKTIDNQEHIYRLCKESLQMHKRTEEYAYIIAVNIKGRILGAFEISHGTVNMTFMNPREIFVKLLLLGSTCFFLVHNHPSQIVLPSYDDVCITKRIQEAGKMVGIELLDHLIVGEDGYYSFKQEEEKLKNEE